MEKQTKYDLRPERWQALKEFLRLLPVQGAESSGSVIFKGSVLILTNAESILEDV
jgi:hypothetical protein